MDSPEMVKLNPLGGYAQLKLHLDNAHDIPSKDLAMYNVLCNAITDKLYYHRMEEQMR